MFKRHFLLILIFLMTCASSYGAAQAAAEKDSKNYIFLIFVEELKYSDLNGAALPNIKKIKDSGASYRHLTNTSSEPVDNVLAGLGKDKDVLYLPKILIDNGIRCLVVDGSGKLSQTLLNNNRIDVITESSDHLAMDKFLTQFADKSYQFVTIYLDDTSQPAPGQNSARFNQWSSADNQIGRLVNNLISTGRLTDSTLILAGGGEQSPLIIYGNKISVPAKYFHCQQNDIAPTICQIFGITPPNDLPGSILYECLQPISNDQLVNHLKTRIIDLQKECLVYTQEIAKTQKEQHIINLQKAEVEEERKKIARIISEKNQAVNHLIMQIKLLKFFGAVIILLMLAGYIVEYKILRKKFLMFP
ncbi:hypothetical protein [Desulfoscipio geothermicus]|uniref:Uncharacterized protein n=1 Tax=Desulfoscipio geothermicus DSM 3669 TaxID=1121426 RepID=A0A1I6EL81_9FIRM|nr:hypothetical protein [Desulfoscipio geothermicus]SFR18311.1 hypothetical protein SAMN05660706_1564 [Desulfoscipio geothermicus DSM 3669]